MNIRYFIFAMMFAVCFIILKNWSDYSSAHYLQQENNEEIIETSTIKSANSEIPEISQQQKKIPVSDTVEDAGINIETDNFNIKLSQHGDIVYTSLKKHKKHLHDQTENNDLIIMAITKA